MTDTYIAWLNTPVTHDYDQNGRISISYNARGQRVFQARASHRLDDTDPGRARAGYADPLDAYLSNGTARTALVKPNRQEP